MDVSLLCKMLSLIAQRTCCVRMLVLGMYSSVERNAMCRAITPVRPHPDADYLPLLNLIKPLCCIICNTLCAYANGRKDDWDRQPPFALTTWPRPWVTGLQLDIIYPIVSYMY